MNVLCRWRAAVDAPVFFWHFVPGTSYRAIIFRPYGAFFTKRICQSNQIVFKGLDMLKRNIETEFFSQKRSRSLARNSGKPCVIAPGRLWRVSAKRRPGVMGQKRSMKHEACPRSCVVQRSKNFLPGFNASRKPGPQSTGLRPLLTFKRRKKKSDKERIGI